MKNEETYIKIIAKYRELSFFLDEHLFVDLSPDTWKKRKDLYNELQYLVDQIPIKQEEVGKAINFILESPYQDDFVCRNVQQSMYCGEATDNSVELAMYWSKQYNVVINWLHDNSNK